MKFLSTVVSLAAMFMIPSGCSQNQHAGRVPRAQVTGMHEQSGMHHAVAGVDAATKLRQDMRKLWTDHTVWTRDYIIAAVADAPDQKAASERLMKNQDDIGKAIAGFYSTGAGQQLTELLKEHITIAVDLVKAAKAEDKAGVEKVSRSWQENGDEIAEFLSKANPNWSRTMLAEMMRMHLSTTTDEVTARLHEDWAGDVKAYDAAYEHILKMADALSEGIIKQFPDRFRE
jgi:hypothetical protein